MTQSALLSTILDRITTKSRKITLDAFRRTVGLTFDSITVGSAITGAPGQPVDEGTLRASWHEDFESQTRASITTPLGDTYAIPIEEGEGAYGPLTLRSEVGGFHSVAMTKAGFKDIQVVALAAARQAAAGT